MPVNNNSNLMASLNDATQRFYVHKYPFSTVKISDLSQELSLNSAFSTSSTITSNFMGNPTTLTLFLNSSTAATVTILLSPNGDFYYTYGTVVLAANGNSITTIPGAGFIQLSTNANISTFNAHVVANS